MKIYVLISFFVAISIASAASSSAASSNEQCATDAVQLEPVFDDDKVKNIAEYADIREEIRKGDDFVRRHPYYCVSSRPRVNRVRHQMGPSVEIPQQEMQCAAQNPIFIKKSEEGFLVDRDEKLEKCGACGLGVMGVAEVQGQKAMTDCLVKNLPEAMPEAADARVKQDGNVAGRVKFWEEFSKRGTEAVPVFFPRRKVVRLPEASCETENSNCAIEVTYNEDGEPVTRQANGMCYVDKSEKSEKKECMEDGTCQAFCKKQNSEGQIKYKPKETEKHNKCGEACTIEHCCSLVEKKHLDGAVCENLFPGEDHWLFWKTRCGKNICPQDKDDERIRQTGGTGSATRQMFYDVTKEICQNQNWAEGSLTKPGFEEGAKPCEFPKAALQEKAKKIPLILGFGDDINRKCEAKDKDSNLTPEQWKKIEQWQNALPTRIRELDDEGKCCMKEGKYFHRLWLSKGGQSKIPSNENSFLPDDSVGEGENERFPRYVGWTFCMNLRWLMCGAAGFMKNQQTAEINGKSLAPGEGGAIMITTTPDKILVTDHEDDHQTAGVTVHEYCLLNKVCENPEDLWSMKKPGIFNCKFKKVTDRSHLMDTPHDDTPKDASKPDTKAELEVADTNVFSSGEDPEANTGLFSLNALLLQGVVICTVLVILYNHECSKRKDMDEYSQLLEQIVDEKP